MRAGAFKSIQVPVRDEYLEEVRLLMKHYKDSNLDVDIILLEVLRKNANIET